METGLLAVLLRLESLLASLNKGVLLYAVGFKDISERRIIG